MVCTWTVVLTFFKAPKARSVYYNLAAIMNQLTNFLPVQGDKAENIRIFCTHKNHTGKRRRGGRRRLSKNIRKPVWAAFVEIFRCRVRWPMQMWACMCDFRCEGVEARGWGAACSGHQPPPWLTGDSPQLFCLRAHVPGRTYLLASWRLLPWKRTRVPPPRAHWTTCLRRPKLRVPTTVSSQSWWSPPTR